MSTTARAPGAMPDFAKLHQLQQKKQKLSKSSSSKSLTEFREFSLSTPKRPLVRAAPTANNENAVPPPTTPRLTAPTTKVGSFGPGKKSEVLASAKPASTPAAIKPIASADPARGAAAPALAPSVAPAAVAIPIALFATPSKPPMPTRPAPPTPSAAAAASILPATVLKAENAPTAEVIPSVAHQPMISEEAEQDDNDSSFNFSDDDDDAAADGAEAGDGFAVDARSMGSILNDDAWKEEDDEVVPLPSASPLSSPLAHALAPMTPRRSTLTGATAANLLTPRSAYRGSIYGGALRTPARVKVDLTRTAASRLTITGVLPHRTAGATVVPASSPAVNGAAQREKALHSMQAAAFIGGSLKDLLHEQPSLSSSMRTPLKPAAKAALSLHAGFMTPNRS